MIAGARATGFYERNPWARLERTLRLTYSITFGTAGEARAAADRINEVHRTVHGIDEITGEPYDALDPELLLWVHACLVDSALEFERVIVSPNGEDVLFVYHRTDGRPAALAYFERLHLPVLADDGNVTVWKVP